MSDTHYTAPILLRGDMIASLSSSPNNVGNPGDAGFGIRMPEATALGTSDDLFRLVWYGNTSTQNSAFEFQNGQFWRLERYDPAQDPAGDPSVGNEGWSTVPGYALELNPRNDLVSDLGAGDEYVVFNSPSGFLLYDVNGGLPAQNTTLVYQAADENGDLATGDNDGKLDFYDAISAVCFCQNTRIATPDGPRLVQDLRPGDLVLTRDHGAQPLRWTGKRLLDVATLAAAAHLRPIRIAAGALAPGVPCDDLRVSPQHRMMVRSRIALRMTGACEVLIAAKHLCGLPGIAPDGATGPVWYHHLLFDRHELVLANCAPAESLFVGAEALRALPAAARGEIAALFPQLIRAADPDSGARPFVTGRQGRSLIQRHQKNARALFEEER